MAHPPESAESDEILLARYLKGDPAAFGVLGQRYETYLLGLSMGLLNHRQDRAMDAVQEVWVRVLRHAKGFRNSCSVKTWLYRITVNVCFDLRKKNKKHDWMAHEVEPQTRSEAEESAMEGTIETGKQLREALEQLSNEQRLLVLLCYHQGLTHPQAAEVLEIPIGTLKSRLHTVLTSLRARLKDEVYS